MLSEQLEDVVVRVVDDALNRVVDDSLRLERDIRASRRSGPEPSRGTTATGPTASLVPSGRPCDAPSRSAAGCRTPRPGAGGRRDAPTAAAPTRQRGPARHGLPRRAPTARPSPPHFTADPASEIALAANIELRSEAGWSAGLLIAMTAVVLIGLLAALGVTIVHMGGLVLRRHTISSGDRVDLRARLARASTSSCEPAGTPRDKRTLA